MSPSGRADVGPTDQPRCPRDRPGHDEKLVWMVYTITGDDCLRCGHDLADWREGLAMAHTAAARSETGRTNCHDAEQRAQLSRAPVLLRALRAASLAAAPAAAIFLRLGLNDMTLQFGQQLFGLLQCQAQGLRRAGGRETASDMHLVSLHTTVRAAQFHRHTPLHPTLPSPTN